jgi:ABC-2 type transport system permease protein
MFSRTPILQLIRCNVRLYIREPEAIFWTYGFPLLMIIGLGIAFDASRDQQTLVDIVAGRWRAMDRFASGKTPGTRPSCD